MNPSKPGWLVIAVIVLAVVNLVTLGFLWFGRPGQPPPRADARGFLIRELHLDAAQVRQFDSLRRGHFAEMEALQDETRRLKDELFAALPRPDAHAAALADSIGAVQSRIEQNTFNHFAALRRLCDPGQQQRFDRIIRDVLHSMAPPGGPPPPRRD